MKYFFRILAFLFISFSFGFCNSSPAYDSVCASMPADETYYANLCSAGSNISFSKNVDNYVYIHEGQRYIKCYVLIYGYSWDQGKIRCEETEKPDDNCIVCSYGSYLSIPKQECPVGQYAKIVDEGNGSQSCSSNCFELRNRRDRFDCICNLFGKGNYVSSKIDSVLEISNGGSSGDFYSGEVQCENGSFTDKDVSDYFTDSLDDSSAISETELKKATSNFMGANDYPSTNYTSGSSGGSRGGDQGNTKPLTSEDEKQEKERAEIDEPPAPQNPSESIKYDEKTNTLTITDTSGKTQAVTPSNVTKNDKGEFQAIKYIDPETGKDIEYKVKDNGTWERIEHQGTGTNPSENDSGTGQGKLGGSSDGEGAGTSEDGKKDGKEDGNGKFEGGEFGALGNANDFDKGSEALSAFEDLDKKSSGLLDTANFLIENAKTILTDFKSSIDSLKEKANELRDNPFSASTVSSCSLNFSLLEQTIDIDVCKYTSQFRNLVYFLIYIPLNVFIAFKLLSLLFLIIVNI